MRVLAFLLLLIFTAPAATAATVNGSMMDLTGSPEDGTTLFHPLGPQILGTNYITATDRSVRSTNGLWSIYLLQNDYLVTANGNQRNQATIRVPSGEGSYHFVHLITNQITRVFLSPVDGNLGAIGFLDEVGFAVRTGADSWTNRVLQAGSERVIITYPDGVTADPVIDVDLSGIEVGEITGLSATNIANGAVSDAEFEALDGVTSALQTQLNAKAATSHTHAATAIANGSVSDAEYQTLDGVTSAIQTQLDAKAATSHTHSATNIANGSVSDAEYQALDGVTSALQTQLDAKAATSHTHSATNIANGSVSDAEFQTLDGVTSAIQTQLDAKAATSHAHDGADITSGSLDPDRLPLNNDVTAGIVPAGGENPGKFWMTDTNGVPGWRDLAAVDLEIGGLSITDNATFDYVTVDRAVYINSDGILTNSVTTATELGHLSGVTSPVQTQLDARLPVNNPTATGTATLPTAAIATQTLGSGTITNGLRWLITSNAVPSVVDLAVTAPDVVRCQVAGAVNITHATNGAALTLPSKLLLLYNGSGSDQTLTVPGAWRPQVLQTIPSHCTNGTITVLRITGIDDTNSSANQTNVLYSVGVF